MIRERYRIDLAGLQSTCEINYARLMRLLPDMRRIGARRRIALSEGSRLLGVLGLTVVESCPYTNTLHFYQEQAAPWLPVPWMQVRVYHDVRMAEVISTDRSPRLQPVYPYPNPDMHQPDEKNQLNLFLGQCLSHMLICGHEPERVV